MLELLRASELLPVIDLLLLNEYDGKPEGYEISGYKLEEYGQNYRERVRRLINDGYLKMATPEESLKSLTSSSLKDILRANGQKLSGNKSELISRIVKNVQPEKYAEQIPKLYTATSRGQQELGWRSVYVENQRQQYRFLNSEIAAVETSLLAKGEYSADRVFEELFLRDTVKHGAAHDFGMLGSTYYGMSQFLKRHGRQEESVTAMLLMLYLGLSGMSNNNAVEQYEALNWIMDARVWSDLDKTQAALNLSDDALKAKFGEAVKLCAFKLPFSYFSVEIMKAIIIDRLHGQMNLLERYRKYRNKPREGNPNYTYYDFSRSRGYDFEISVEPSVTSPSPQPVTKAAANIGCASTMLAFFLMLTMTICLLTGCGNAPNNAMIPATARETLGFKPTAFQYEFNEQLYTLGLGDRLKLDKPKVKYSKNGAFREFHYFISGNPKVFIYGRSYGNKSDDLKELDIFATLPTRQEDSSALDDAIIIYTTALKLINPSMSDAIVSEILSGLNLDKPLPVGEDIWKEYRRCGSAAEYTLSISTSADKVDRVIVLGIERAEDPDTLQVVDLGLTLDEFKAAYKAKAVEYGDSGWNIDGASVQTGSAQDIFSYEFSPSLVMQGAIDKDTRRVKEVWLLFQIRNAEDVPPFVMTYGLLMVTLNPELDLHGRETLISELMLDSRLPELQRSQGSASAVRSNIRYTAQFIREDVLQFIAAARDL